MGGRSKSKDQRSLARLVMPILFVVCLAFVVLAGLAVLPAKTWFSQRQKMAEAEAEISRLEAETAELEQELRVLATDEEMERRARQDFDLVFPGEESYRILPEQP